MIQVSPEEVTKILDARKIQDDIDHPLQIVPEGKLSVALERDSTIPKNPMQEITTKIESKMENNIEDNPDSNDYNKVYINRSIAYVCQTPFIQIMH